MERDPNFYKALNLSVLNYLSDKLHGHNSISELTRVNKELADELGQEVYNMSIQKKLKLQRLSINN